MAKKTWTFWQDHVIRQMSRVNNGPYQVTNFYPEVAERLPQKVPGKQMAQAIVDALQSLKPPGRKFEGSPMSSLLQDSRISLAFLCEDLDDTIEALQELRRLARENSLP
jgi:hypothetical protein